MTVKEILNNENNFKNAVQILLVKMYQSEFKIIDGLNQHPAGLNFVDWLIETLEQA